MGMAKVAVSEGKDERAISRVFAWTFCALIVLGAAVMVFDASGANAQTSTLYTVQQVSNSSTHYRAWVIDARQNEIDETNEDPLAGAELLTTDHKPVQTGRNLELVALVHEPDGQPVQYAEVLFEWSDSRGKVMLRDSTDYRGVAQVHRWVAPSERGHTTTVRVSVETPTWSANRWAWFVPR